MALRASLTRRLSGSPAGLPARPAYGAPGRRAEPSWLTAPAALVGRDASERAAREAAPSEQRWPEQVFDDRASLDALDAPAFETRIDRSASSPGVLVRQPRRPAAIAPEHAPAGAPSPPRSAAPSAVRWTRTPDSVLQERRQRALEAERVALERARAEAQAASHGPGDRVRGTRAGRARPRRAATPRRPRGSAPRRPMPRPEAETVPLWRQPFVAPPGVRFFRTPDRRPVRPAVELAASTAVIAPVASAPAIPEAIVPAPARDWSDLPDWSEVQPWFDAGDWSSVEAWAALEPAGRRARRHAGRLRRGTPRRRARRGLAPARAAAAAGLRPRPARAVRPAAAPRRRAGQRRWKPEPSSGRRRRRDPERVPAAPRPAARPAAGLRPRHRRGRGLGRSVAEAPRRAPVLSAMAARAAIRAAGQPSPVPPAVAAQPEPVPAPTAPSGRPGAERSRPSGW